MRTAQETQRNIIRQLETAHTLADALYAETVADVTRKDANDSAHRWRSALERALAETRDEWVDDEDGAGG